MKVDLGIDDQHLATFDPRLLDLEIVQFTHPLRPSYLYFDFLPILVDRHVPKEAIEQYAKMQAEREVEEFLTAISSSDKLRSWIHRQGSKLEEKRRDTEIETLAGVPIAKSEKAIQMLDSGFEATSYEPLADAVRYFAKAFFNQQKRAFKIPLPQSTMATGVADSDRILKPGEIQLNFSERFKDPITGQSWCHLEGPVLICRISISTPL